MFEDRRIIPMLEEVIHLLHESIRLQFKLLHHFHLHNIVGFTISQTGDDNMALLPIAPGFSPVFTATPVPSGTFPAPGNIPTWVSSDTVNAPITVDSTGLIATVAIPTTATVGAAFTLTVSYTNADGVVATGTTSQTIVAAPPSDITGFTIAQSA